MNSSLTTDDPFVSVVMVAVAALVMMFAMVRFSSAIVATKPRAKSRLLWAGIYATSLAGVTYTVWQVSLQIETIQPTLAILVPAAWIAVNASMIRLWLATGESSERSGKPGELPPDADRIAHVSSRVSLVALCLTVVSLWRLGAPQRLLAIIMTPGQRIGSIAVIVGIAGGLALVAGGAAIALRGGGEMSRPELDDLERQSQFGSRYQGPMMWRGSKYRVFGPARGVQGNIEVSVGDMVNAWRTGVWRRDPQWRIVLLMLFGAVAMITGGSGAIFAFGSPATRLGFGVCLTYGIVQTWIGFRRARSRST